MTGILNVEMLLVHVVILLLLPNVVKNGVNVVVNTGLAKIVVKMDLLVNYLMNFIHNVWLQPQTHLPVVVKNGINVEENIGKVLDVVKKENVRNKMNGILNV